MCAPPLCTESGRRTMRRSRREDTGTRYHRYRSSAYQLPTTCGSEQNIHTSDMPCQTSSSGRRSRRRRKSLLDVDLGLTQKELKKLLEGPLQAPLGKAEGAGRQHVRRVAGTRRASDASCIVIHLSRSSKSHLSFLRRTRRRWC